MFLGQLLHIAQRRTYHKLTIGVETGYNIDLYTIRVRNYLMIKDLYVGDQVLFSGFYISKGRYSEFHLETIVKHTFRECSECNLPLTSNSCLINHDKEAQKLYGEWRVVHKIIREGNIKVFFEKGHYVFAAVATTNHWFRHLFRKLTDNDRVAIEGWRYRQKTSIKTILIKSQPLESDYENMEACQEPVSASSEV